MFQKIKAYIQNKENQKDFLISTALGISIGNTIVMLTLLYILNTGFGEIKEKLPEKVINKLDHRYERLPEQKKIAPKEFWETKHNP